MAPGRGEISDKSQGKERHAPSPHRWVTDGHLVKAVHVTCHGRREIVGRQGKGAHVLDPRCRATTPVGDRNGARLEITEANRLLNNKTHLGNDCAKVAMSADKLDVTRASIARILSLPGRRQLPRLVVTFADRGDATPPAT